MNGVAKSLDVSLALAYNGAYAWCASCFLKKQLQGKTSRRATFAGLLFCSYGIMAFFLERNHAPYILSAICRHAALLGLATAVFQGEKEKKLLAAVVLAAITELAWNFGSSFFSCLGLFLTRLQTGSHPVDFMGGRAERAVQFLTYGLGATAICFLSKWFVPVFNGKRKGWYLYLAIPVLCIVLVTDMANWAAANGIMVHDWGTYGLYENQLFSHSAMCIFTGLAMAATVFFVLGADRIDREERAREHYRCQVAYYEMMEGQYSQMERLRHDMKNHMVVLGNLIQNQKWEAAKGYVREMSVAGGIEAGDEVTGSLAMDALLYHKRQQAKERGVCWQCDARLPEGCPVKEVDLCIIVGNILDNALEACERAQEKRAVKKQVGQPFIHVHMGAIKKCLFLEVRNRTDLEGRQEICGSRKESPKGHGLGLGNIKSAVANYNGAVHIEVENYVFTISVLLPLS